MAIAVRSTISFIKKKRKEREPMVKTVGSFFMP